jgi:cytochrome c oxidase subunit 4
MIEELHHPAGTRVYWKTAIALLVLLVLSLLSGALPLGGASLPVALGIAAVKVILVGLFFMHLRGSSGVARLFAGGGVFWLGILIALSLADYVSR